MNKEVILLSGDNENTVKIISEQVGISKFLANIHEIPLNIINISKNMSYFSSLNFLLLKWYKIIITFVIKNVIWPYIILMYSVISNFLRNITNIINKILNITYKFKTLFFNFI